VAPTSAKFRLIDLKIEGGIDAFVATRRSSSTWQEISQAIYDVTGEVVNRETLRLWYLDRIETSVRAS
jgi:hypothetical protein